MQVAANMIRCLFDVYKPPVSLMHNAQCVLRTRNGIPVNNRGLGGNPWLLVVASR